MSNLPVQPERQPERPSDGPPPKRARHLMDPANPVRPVNNQAVTNVQRWVMTALLMTVALILAISWVLIAGTIVEKQSGQIALLVNSAAFGILGVLASRVIHQKSLLTPWVVVGCIPALVGASWVLR